jgi:hypothetical protein
VVLARVGIGLVNRPGSARLDKAVGESGLRLFSLSRDGVTIEVEVGIVVGTELDVEFCLWFLPAKNHLGQMQVSLANLVALRMAIRLRWP